MPQGHNKIYFNKVANFIKGLRNLKTLKKIFPEGYSVSSTVIEGARTEWSVIFLSVYQKKNKACVLTSDVLFSLHLKANGLCFNSLSNVSFCIIRHKTDNCSGKS